MAKKYIEADALRDELHKHEDYKGGLSYEWEAIIADFPAADVRENVRGEWIKTIRIRKTEGADYYDPVWFCPACGQEYDAAFASHNVKYCYRCGADIRGEEHK